MCVCWGGGWGELCGYAAEAGNNILEEDKAIKSVDIVCVCVGGEGGGSYAAMRLKQGTTSLRRTRQSRV